MSKIRMPSKQGSPQAVVSLALFGLHVVAPLICGVSLDRKRADIESAIYGARPILRRFSTRD